MAKRHKSAASLLLAQTQRYARMKGTLIELHDRSVREAHADLHKLTSGQIKTAQLIAMGHPYGRGARAGANGKSMRGARGRTRIPVYPINQQTGRLRRSIYLRAIGRHRYRLGANAPYAKYQFAPAGTERMVRRDVVGGRKIGGRIGQIERRWRARLKGIRMGLRKAGRS